MGTRSRDDITRIAHIVRLQQQGPGERQRRRFACGTAVRVRDMVEVDIVGESKDAPDRFARGVSDHVGEKRIHEALARPLQRGGTSGVSEHRRRVRIARRIAAP